MKTRIRQWVEKLLWSRVAGFLNSYQGEVIVVTGSIAKTSTKEAIFILLSRAFGRQSVWRTPGNLNTRFGVGLALVGFRSQPNFWLWIKLIWRLWFVRPNRLTGRLLSKKYLIFELAADKPGDFNFLLGFIKPTLAVVTAIGPAHLEFFGSTENLAREKEKVVRACAASGGRAVLNQSDKRVAQMAKLLPPNRVSWFRAELPDIANQAARRVGTMFRIDQGLIKQSLARTKLAGRGRLIRTQNGATVIDDSYNANPLSIKASLIQLDRLWSKRGRKGRKLALIGDMLELGRYEALAHREVGREARQVVDQLLTYGQASRSMKASRHFTQKHDAAEYLGQILLPDDIVLIKASRGMGLDEVVEELV